VVKEVIHLMMMMMIIIIIVQFGDNNSDSSLIGIASTYVYIFIDLILVI